MMQTTTSNYRGRGSQTNTIVPFHRFSYVNDYPGLIDEEMYQDVKTEVIYTVPKTVVNTVDSPDLGLEYSLNPYQGCEHGCVYCYARNTHEYWGFSAGMEFEQKIIVKQNVIEVLEKQLSSKKWQPKPILLSGNTDCYQPLERKFEITRKVLQTCLKFKHPVSIITKNALILRDLDLLKELASFNLVKVMISITGTDEIMRSKLEPRTSTYHNRFKVIKTLSESGIPCGVMLAPIIPGINNHEIPSVIDLAAKAGASCASYQIVRLNGSVGPIFKDWLSKTFPDRADKVWNQICDAHGGKVNDSRFGVRMRGEGKMAKSIKQLFDISVQRFIKKEDNFEYNLKDFNYKAANEQLSLF